MSASMRTKCNRVDAERRANEQRRRNATRAERFAAMRRLGYFESTIDGFTKITALSTGRVVEVSYSETAPMGFSTGCWVAVMLEAGEVTGKAHYGASDVALRHAREWVIEKDEKSGRPR